MDERQRYRRARARKFNKPAEPGTVGEVSATPETGAVPRKRDLRRSLRTRRRARDPGAGAATSRAIAELAAGVPWVTRARTLAGYVASDGEPDVEIILEAARARGALVVLPRQRADGSLELVVATPETPLARGASDVLEPAGPAVDPALLPGPATLLAPAVALDRLGRRLGRGGGAYDRLLVELRRLGWTIVGVCLAADLLDELPEEPHDQRVDAVLVDTGFLVVGEPVGSEPAGSEPAGAASRAATGSSPSSRNR